MIGVDAIATHFRYIFRLGVYFEKQSPDSFFYAHHDFALGDCYYYNFLHRLSE